LAINNERKLEQELIRYIQETSYKIKLKSVLENFKTLKHKIKNFNQN